MDKINYHLRKPNEVGVFHDSRKDSQTIRKVLNDVIQKVNEIIDYINQDQLNSKER
jgi:hypothetical protein